MLLNKFAVIFLLILDTLGLNTLLLIALQINEGYRGSFPTSYHPPITVVVNFSVLGAIVLANGYQHPKRWSSSQIGALIARASLTSFFTAGAVLMLLRAVYLLPNTNAGTYGIIILITWAGLPLWLTINRILFNRVLTTFYTRNIGQVPAIIVGDQDYAARLKTDIEHNPWLGHAVKITANYLDPQTTSMLTKGSIIWLVPPLELPSLLFEPAGRAYTWYMLPEHFEQILITGLRHLTDEQRAIFSRQVRHNLHLPSPSVAMLGLRGVPANYGGIETHVEELGSHLVKQGIRVVIYCHDKYTPDQKMYRGMELRRLPSVNTKHLETITHTFLATIHALFFQEEIFHYHALGPSTLSWIPRLLGRKVVVTIHGLDWNRAKWGYFARQYLRLGEWTALHIPNRTIVISKTLENFYKEQNHRSLICIPNGYKHFTRLQPDLIRQFGLEKNNYVLYVGRLVPEKGCHLLLEAFQQVKTDKKLIFAGRLQRDLPYHRRLLGMAAGIERVHFIDFVKGHILEELYSNAYLVVNASDVEGLAITLFEALNYGNCLLVSNIQENIEVVGDSAVTFQSGNSEDLKRQIQVLVNDPSLVEEKRQKAREDLTGHLKWETVADMTKELYQTLVE